MLFNSLEFVFAFMPIVFAGFLVLGRMGLGLWSCGWLALASIFFYGFWAPEYILLLLTSIIANYSFGAVIQKSLSENLKTRGKMWLGLAIVLNLSALAYFKYINFLFANLNLALDTPLVFAEVILPIGISFFTFTQIAYLVDTYHGKVRETNPIHYLLFVTYFPHLIAGPILHHAEMMPQFRKRKTFTFSRANFLSGLLVFLIGLFKKVILADGIQPYVGPVFDAPLGQTLTFVEAWGGALAYTLQLYFDFSGYSDMAIGLSRMLNIELPLNFNSPYKAKNISDFWRRWHMTLSRFLRDYLYVPLGGNRCGKTRRYANLMLTMLLGGLWHGAGWSFVVWGGLHGIFLACNHAWQSATRGILGKVYIPGWILTLASVAITFLCVVIAWVFFRAKDIGHAIRILDAMTDISRLSLPLDSIISSFFLSITPNIPSASLAAFGGDRQFAWTLILLFAVWALPNTQQMIARLASISWPSIVKFPEVAWFIIGATSFLVALVLVINETRGVSEFIYFNF